MDAKEQDFIETTFIHVRCVGFMSLFKQLPAEWNSYMAKEVVQLTWAEQEYNCAKKKLCCTAR